MSGLTLPPIEPTTETAIDRLLSYNFKLFPLSNYAKTPARGLNWQDPSNFITEKLPGVTGYGMNMRASGLIGIDIDAVSHADGKTILSVDQMLKKWRALCRAQGITDPSVTLPHCVTAGGKGHPGLHF